jgi:hypothetical protein
MQVTVFLSNTRRGAGPATPKQLTRLITLSEPPLSWQGQIKGGRMNYIIIAVIFLIIGVCMGVLVASMMIGARGENEKEL